MRPSLEPPQPPCPSSSDGVPAGVAVCPRCVSQGGVVYLEGSLSAPWVPGIWRAVVALVRCVSGLGLQVSRKLGSPCQVEAEAGWLWGCCPACVLACLGRRAVGALGVWVSVCAQMAER